MKPARGKGRPKATICYLSIVILLTVLLFSLGISSIAREKQRLDKLSNINTLGHALATEVSKGTWEVADGFLNDSAVRMMIGSLTGMNRDVRPEQARRWLSAISRHYPMVDHFFVAENGVMTLPAGPAGTPAVSTGRRKAADETERFLSQAAETQHFTKPTASSVCFDVVPIGTDLHQLFHTSLSSGSRSVTYGFSVNPNWAREFLLPRTVTTVGLKGSVLPNLQTNPVLLGLKPSANELHFPLQEVLPFLEVSIPREYVGSQAAAARRNIVYLLFANFLFVAVIGIGTVLGGRAMRQLQSQKIENDCFSAFSHDLKNPLTIIQLYTETLLRDDTLSKKSRTTYYRIINRETENLGQLLENLLTLAKYEKGTCRYHLAEGDLVESLRPRVQGYSEHLSLRGFRVVTSWPDSLPVTLFDRDAVYRAVLNLMDNARKYSGEAKYIRVAALARKREVMIEVEDHGIGIPLDEQSQLFEGFFRGSASGERKGFGIGLYIVKQIMDSHGGRIEVQSQQGVGSTFRLIFPIATSTLGATRKRQGVRLVQMARRVVSLTSPRIWPFFAKDKHHA